MSDEISARKALREEEARAEMPEQNVSEATPPVVLRENHAAGGANRVARNRQPEPMMPLFSGNELQGLRARWESLQVGFVDEPKHSVEEADRLVSETINSLSRNLAAEREKLEQQWHRGERAPTEDLRLALQRYRSFFERLLAI